MILFCVFVWGLTKQNQTQHKPKQIIIDQTKPNILKNLFKLKASNQILVFPYISMTLEVFKCCTITRVYNN